MHPTSPSASPPPSPNRATTFLSPGEAPSAAAVRRMSVNSEDPAEAETVLQSRFDVWRTERSQLTASEPSETRLVIFRPQRALQDIPLPPTCGAVPDCIGPNSGVSVDGYFDNWQQLAPHRVARTLACRVLPRLGRTEWTRAIAGFRAAPASFAEASLAHRRLMAEVFAGQKTASGAEELARALNILPSDILREAVLEALTLLGSAANRRFVENVGLGFGAVDVATKTLKDTLKWCAFPQPEGYALFDLSGPDLSYDALQRVAAASLCVHNLYGSAQWQVSTRPWFECADREPQRSAFKDLMKLFAHLGPADCPRAWQLGDWWVRVPEYMRPLVLELSTDWVDIERWLAPLVQTAPQNTDSAKQFIQGRNNVALLRQVLGDEISPRDLGYLKSELFSLDDHTRQRLRRHQAELPLFLARSPGGVQRHSLRDFIEQIRVQRLRQAFERLERPDEGGASTVREGDLWNSVMQLCHGRKLDNSRTIYREIDKHLRKCEYLALDKANRHNHTPRSKALHAFAAQWPKAKPAPALTDSHGQLSTVGVIALAWKVSGEHTGKKRQHLREDFIMALSRCTRDEDERLETMPGPSCRRGYAEQLVLIFNGLGYNLPIEKSYGVETVRPKELFYTLAPPFFEELDGETPTRLQLDAFCSEAMRQCSVLIEAAYGSRGSDREKQDERRKALGDLRQVCRDTKWPLPNVALWHTYGVLPPEDL